jgi:hypothetical protein
MKIAAKTPREKRLRLRLRNLHFCLISDKIAANERKAQGVKHEQIL